MCVWLHANARTHLQTLISGRGSQAPDASSSFLFLNASSSMVISSASVFSCLVLALFPRQRRSPACTACLLRGDLSAVNAKCTTYTGALCCFVFMSIALRVDKLITLGVCEFVYLCTEGFWVIWCLWSPNGVWSVCLRAPRLLFIA